MFYIFYALICFIQFLIDHFKNGEKLKVSNYLDKIQNVINKISKYIFGKIENEIKKIEDENKK
ncbi:MAG: hypothetical protein B6I24_06050 [Bacteroidetes bacterium 4572_128]|nr:MAG: hypothetical protein B6I24_06050 [Bacteroidetes bacterium 4572_128]